MSKSRIDLLPLAGCQSKLRRNQTAPCQSNPASGSTGHRSPESPGLRCPLSALAGYEWEPCRNQFDGSRITGHRESSTVESAKDDSPLFGRNRQSPARSRVRRAGGILGLSFAATCATAELGATAPSNATASVTERRSAVEKRALQLRCPCRLISRLSPTQRATYERSEMFVDSMNN